MSTFDDLPDESGRAWDAWVLQSGRRWAWIVPGLVASLCVYASYLLTHAYPAFGAGLFLAMSQRVVEAFPLLPSRIPHYTSQGVPFAYPPLQFYVTGGLVAIGLDGVTVARHLPNLASILALVPLYLFAEELLGSRRGAGVATLLAATAPPLLQWQISAGGIVRAPAYLFTVIGFYTGLRLFRDGDHRWVVLSLLAFTLTVLSHPVYTLFFVLTYLTMFMAFQPTVGGLLRGAVVGVGGVVIATPWWMQVVSTHGIDALTGAAGTHGGIGNQLPDLVSLFTSPRGGSTQAVLFATRPELFDFSTPGMVVLTVWSLAIVVAWTVLLWDRNRMTFLPAWALLSVVLVSKPRFSFLIGSFMIGAFVDRHAVPALDRRVRPIVVRGVGSAAVGRKLRSVLDQERATGLAHVALGVVLFAAATTTGVMYAGSQLDTHAGSTSQPAFIDDEDVDAMSWVRSNAHPEATFVVLGDAAEWFPYRTERTIAVGPWGVEWRGSGSYQSQLAVFNRISTCESAGCLTVHLHRHGVHPDYVYVPKGEYTVRGMEMTLPASLEQSLLTSDRYDLVHENAGVMVFEYDDEPLPAIPEQQHDPPTFDGSEPQPPDRQPVPYR